MKYSIETWGDGDETDVLGVADSRDEARDIVREYIKSMMGVNYFVPYLTVEFNHNSVRGALVKEKVTHISQDANGNWTLIWHIDGEIKDRLFLVDEE